MVSQAQLTKLKFFLQRPALYPELTRRARQWLFAPRSPELVALDASRAEATQWCAQRAVDTQQALRCLHAASGEPIEQLYPDVFARARAAREQCPVAMGGPADLDLLYRIAEHLRAMRVVETGVAYGWSSLALLLSLQHRPGARLISTDMPYLERDNDAYVGCIVPDPLRAQWRIIRQADRQAVPKALKQLGSIDLCHYDSDKGYEGRQWAYPVLWNALRAGGVFVSDDVGDNVCFRDFAARVACEPIVVRIAAKHVGILVKPGGASTG
jgi:predicted O-methyltransferase YrrM